MKIFDLDDATLHGKDWDPLVKEFMGRVQKYCVKHGSLWDSTHMLRDFGTTDKKPKPSVPYVQLAAIIGHSTDSSALKMVKDDFYTFVQKNPNSNKGIRQPELDRPGNPTPTYEFSSNAEVENFLGYCQTDLARLCLSIYKTNQDLSTGALSMVPWMDFTRHWTDDQLFTELGYAKGHPIREYAKKFLPDYHGLYTNASGVVNKTY